MNKKGFVLAETLVVTIFVLLIFNILYNSAVPLLGRYHRIAYYNDLDATYDLYHIRNLVEHDANFDSIMNKNYAILQCSNETLADFTSCNNLYASLGIEYSTNIDIKDEVIYLKKSAINNVKSDPLISTQIKDYLDTVDLPANALILQNNGYVSYLDINPSKNNLPQISFSVVGTAYSTGYKRGAKITVTCTSSTAINSFSTTLNGNSSGIDKTNTSTNRSREITVANSGIAKITGVCKCNNGKEYTKTLTYAIFD